jgi:hypothetical protein
MNKAAAGRIWFEGNPWPDGHRLISCELVGAIHPAWGAYSDDARYVGPALSCAIEIRTAAYDEEDSSRPLDESSSDEDDWTSRDSWLNYGAAWIGASASSATPGFLVSDGRTPFDFHKAEHRFRVDPLPLSLPDFSRFFTVQAFGCYVRGHDAVADHDIRLHSRASNGRYVLDWTGRLANAYAGMESFDHVFRVQATNVALKEISLWYLDAGRAREYLGIDIDAGMTPEQYLAPFVTDIDAFRFETRLNGGGQACVFAVPKHH